MHQQQQLKHQYTNHQLNFLMDSTQNYVNPLILQDLVEKKLIEVLLDATVQQSVLFELLNIAIIPLYL